MNILYKSVCQIDTVGRLVLPKPLRKLLNIVGKDELTVTVTEDGILLSKKMPSGDL